MANGDPVLTASGNPFFAGGNPVIEGKAIPSQTCKLSLANGLAFLTSSSLSLSSLAGKPYKITLNDGAKNLVGWIKSAGVAKTITNLYTSDFSADVNGCSGNGVAVSGNIDAIGGENDWLRATLNALNAIHVVQRWKDAAAAWPEGILDKCLYDMFYRYMIPSTNSHADGVRLRQWASSESYEAIQQTLDAATDRAIVYTATMDSVGVTFSAYDGAAQTFKDAGGDDVFYLKNIVVDKVITPDATGVVIKKAADDDTEDWASIEAGFNPNTTSFILTITKS